MPELMEPPCEITAPTLTVRIEHDQDCESPMDCDGQWKLYSFSHRHNNYEDPESFRDEHGNVKIGLRRKLDVGLAFLLDYFEHGQGCWSRSGHGPQCQWDNSPGAGLLIWEHKPSDIGAKTMEARGKDADSFLDVYNDWANGNCYGYVIEDADEEIDSCWGFIGDDVLRGVHEGANGRPYEIVGDLFDGETYKEKA